MLYYLDREEREKITIEALAERIIRDLRGLREEEERHKGRRKLLPIVTQNLYLHFTRRLDSAPELDEQFAGKFSQAIDLLGERKLIVELRDQSTPRINLTATGEELDLQDLDGELEAIIEGKTRVFLSYSTLDKEVAGQIKRALQDSGLEAFLAHEDIEPTEDWVAEIRDNLHKCDFFIPVLTENFRESKWTDQEAGIAIGLGKSMLSVMLTEEPPHGFLNRWQGLPLDKDDIYASAVKLAKHIKPSKQVSSEEVSGKGQKLDIDKLEFLLESFAKGEWDSVRLLLDYLQKEAAENPIYNEYEQNSETWNDDSINSRINNFQRKCDFSNLSFEQIKSLVYAYCKREKDSDTLRRSFRHPARHEFRQALSGYLEQIINDITGRS